MPPEWLTGKKETSHVLTRCSVNHMTESLKSDLFIHLSTRKSRCGHCKKLKPDWDKLIEDFASSSTQLVADVDCTADGKALCDANGVKGYPTLKWGDPSDLQDYQGGRSYDDLKKFADENLK
jgi:hypothetical protein